MLRRTETLTPGFARTTVTYDPADSEGKLPLVISQVDTRAPFKLSADVNVSLLSISSNLLNIYGPNLSELPEQVEYMIPILRKTFTPGNNISIFCAGKVALVGITPVKLFHSKINENVLDNDGSKYIELHFPAFKGDHIDEGAYSELFGKISDGRFNEPEEHYSLLTRDDVETFDYKGKLEELQEKPELRVKRLETELQQFRRQAYLDSAVAASLSLRPQELHNGAAEAARIGKERFLAYKEFISGLEHILRLVKGEKKAGAHSIDIITAYKNYSVSRDSLQKSWGIQDEEEFDFKLAQYCEKYDEQSNIVSLRGERPVYSNEETVFNAARSTLQQALENLGDKINQNIKAKLSSFVVLVDESITNRNGREVSIRQAQNLCLSLKAYTNLREGGDFLKKAELLTSSAENIGYMTREEEQRLFSSGDEDPSAVRFICQSIENVRYGSGFFTDIQKSRERLDEVEKYMKATRL